MLDPILAAVSLGSVLAGAWILQRPGTAPASWFFSSLAAATLAVATYPIRDAHPLLGSMFFVYGGLGPVLIAGGAVALVGREVPRLLLPLFVAYGLVRSGLHLAGYSPLAGLLGIAPALVLGWAAVIAIRNPPSRGEELPAKTRAAAQLARIRSATEHAARLTEQMLTYSGKTLVTRTAIELSNLVQDLSDLLEASVGRNCRLSFELGSSLRIEGDATRLCQVILNLVTNAHEALEDGRGSVRIRTGCDHFDAAELSRMSGPAEARPGRYVWLEVSDDGERMSLDTRRQSFEPFFTTKFSGCGLGLASVLGIIRAHGGLVDLDSEPGRGTRFRVLLPPSTAEPALRLAPQPVDGIPRRILVVDDDEAVLELAGEFLRRAGYEFHLAAGGREAVELFSKKRDEIDVVILDLSMPDLDGSEVLREIQAIRPDVAVVLATGHSRDSVDQGLFCGPGRSFLSKPYEPEQLLEAIRAASSGLQ